MAVMRSRACTVDQTLPEKLRQNRWPFLKGIDVLLPFIFSIKKIKQNISFDIFIPPKCLFCAYKNNILIIEDNEVWEVNLGKKKKKSLQIKLPVITVKDFM